MCVRACACVCVHARTVWIFGAYGSQRRVLDPQELEEEIVVSNQANAWEQNQGRLQEQKVLVTVLSAPEKGILKEK